MIILAQNMETEQNFVTRILIVLLFTLKQKIFLKIFLVMLRNGMILPIDKNKKVSGLFKDESGGKMLLDLEQKHMHI